MRKKLFKLLLLVVFVFSFSFSLASCGVDDPVEPTNSGSANTPTPTATPTGTNTSSSSTTEEEIFEIDSNYYLNLLSEQDSVVFGFKDLSMNIDDLEISVDDDSYVELGVSEDKVLMNAYLKGQYRLDMWEKVVHDLEIWASLDGEEFICRAINISLPCPYNKYLTNSVSGIFDPYDETILYKEFSLSKDLVFGNINKFVNEYFDPHFDANEVESLNDITSLFGLDTEEIDKAYVAGKVENLLSMFFESAIDENVTWTFKYDEINEQIDSFKDVTVESIVDSYLGEGTYKTLLTLFNPQNTVNIGKYTLNDLLITSDDDEVGYTTPEDVDKTLDMVFNLLPLVMEYELFDIPEGASAFMNKDMIIYMVSSMLGETPIKKVEVTEWKDNTTYYVIDEGEPTPVDTKTVTVPVAGTDYYVMKKFSELLTEDSLKITVNEIGANIYAYANMADPNFDPSELENFDVTMFVYPMLSQYKDMTVYGVLANIIDMFKDEDDVEFVEVNVTEWAEGVPYFVKNGDEYEPVDTDDVTTPVSGTKYYVVKLTTADEAYEMVKNILDEIESTAISFVTDKEANILNASVTFDNSYISGTITLDFTKEYTDELHEELTTYIPYAEVDEKGSIDSFVELINDNIFDNLTEYELIKEDNKIVGFKYTSGGTIKNYLFDVPATSKDDVSELEVEKSYQYGNIWEYRVNIYCKEANEIKTVKDLFYNTETKKFIVKEYDEGVVVQEGGSCTDVKVVKYTNKEYKNDYYYSLHYTAHHATEWFVEKAGVDDEGEVYYRVYFICDHCNQKIIADDHADEDDTFSGHEVFDDVDVEYKYNPVKDEITYYERTNMNIEYVTSDYPETNKVFEGLSQIADYKAIKYVSSGIVIIYITVGEQGTRNGLIVLNSDGEVIGRFGSGIVKN